MPVISQKREALELFRAGEKILTNVFFENLSIAQAVAGQKSIFSLRKDGEEIIFLFTKILNEALPFLMHELTSDSVIDYARMALKEIPEWKPEDIILCVQRGIAGKYGKSYGKFTFQVLMDWIYQYNTERFDYLEQESVKENELHKKEELKVTGQKRYSEPVKMNRFDTLIHEQTNVEKEYWDKIKK